jgi:Flagellar hook-length control protein FliK
MAGLDPLAPQARGALTRLQIPFTPFAFAAARMLPAATALVSRALGRLDAALSSAGPEPHANRLRTLLPFTARIDPAKTQALTEQLMAYVSGVAASTEAKLYRILRLRDEGRPAIAQTVALEYDVKATIAALERSNETPPELRPRLQEALTALTALQLGILDAHERNSRTVAIPLANLPAERVRDAQLRLGRDSRVELALDLPNLGFVTATVTRTERGIALRVEARESKTAERIRKTLPALHAHLTGSGRDVVETSSGVISSDAALPRLEFDLRV